LKLFHRIPSHLFYEKVGSKKAEKFVPFTYINFFSFSFEIVSFTMKMPMNKEEGKMWTKKLM
jgi:hypothetical protein